jgi:hypothetical protein
MNNSLKETFQALHEACPNLSDMELVQLALGQSNGKNCFVNLSPTITTGLTSSLYLHKIKDLALVDKILIYWHISDTLSSGKFMMLNSCYCSRKFQ